MVREDVRSIGEAIGVQFSGNNNIFRVLARMGKGMRKVSVEGEGGSGGKIEHVSNSNSKVLTHINTSVCRR